MCFDSRGERSVNFDDIYEHSSLKRLRLDSNVLVQNLRASDGDSDTIMNDEAFEREISDLGKSESQY